MDILIALIVAVAFALALRTPMIHCPGVFYGVALVVDVLFLSGILANLNANLYRELLPFLRRALFPYALFVVVMFIGVLPESSKLRTYLKPVRGPLSITAALLAVCHMASYFDVYASVALKGFATTSDSTMAALLMAIVLAILLFVLTVTSFALVRRRMATKTWRFLQKAAYGFFALFTVHAVVLLLPSSMNGGTSALAVSIYSGVFLLYVILRVARWVADRHPAPACASAADAQATVDLELDYAL